MEYMSVNCVYLVMVKYIVFITLHSEEEFKWTLDDIVSPSEATVSQQSEIQPFTADSTGPTQPFTADSTGPTERTKEATTLLETFQLLLPDSILESIVKQTKLFGGRPSILCGGVKSIFSCECGNGASQTTSSRRLLEQK